MSGLNIARKLKQNAIYWSSPVPDGLGGKTFADGIAIKVRWEDKQVLFVNDLKEEELSSSVVMVDRLLDKGGYLFRGLESDLESGQTLSTNPETIRDAKEIRNLGDALNLRNKVTVRQVMLS